MPAFKSHHTATSEQAWDGPANKKRVKSGAKRAYYSRIYAHYDPSGQEGAKETYNFIHHEVGADGTPGPANTTACSSGIAILNGGRGGTTIPAADRAGVHAHLATHLQDAKKEAPPLKNLGEIKHPQVFQSFQDKVWAILPAKLDEIVAVVEAHLDGKKIEWPEAAGGKGAPGAPEEAYQVQDGVAVLPVYGTLDKRMNLFSKMSGGTSYELLGAQIRKALADPKVSALLLDVDSPGGSVDGVKTVADQILAARGDKPIVAFANGQATSAAYWIASAADLVMADDTAVVGSIGVVMTHFDRSGADAQRGVKRTHIFSGRYKVAGSDAQPLSPDDQAYLQSLSDTYYQMFLEGVAQTRGQNPVAVHEGMGDGRLFIGQQAKDAGLVDKIGTFDDALALAKSMAPGTGQGGMKMDKATLESQHPEIFAEVKALGAAEVMAEADKVRAEAQEAGVKSERARIVEVFEAAGGQGLLLQVIQDGTGVKDAMKLFLTKHDQVKAESLAAMRTAAPPLVGTVVPVIETHTDAPRGNLPLEERAKAEWDKDAKLKEEFGGKFELYLTYQRQKEAGNIKGI